MTVNRTTETPVAAAAIDDTVMDQAYGVEVCIWSRRERLAVVMSTDEVEAFVAELTDAATEAINTYRVDHAPADPFDAALAYDQYIWVTATHRGGGLGLWDKQADRVAWWDSMPNETDRLVIGTNLRSGRDDMYTWWPADSVRPFEIAVFA